MRTRLEARASDESGTPIDANIERGAITINNVRTIAACIRWWRIFGILSESIPRIIRGAPINEGIIAVIED